MSNSFTFLVATALLIPACSVEDNFVQVDEFHFQVNEISKTSVYLIIASVAADYNFVDKISGKSYGNVFGKGFIQNTDPNPELRQLWKKDGSSFLSYFYTEAENCFTFSLSIADEDMSSRERGVLDLVASSIESRLGDEIEYFGKEICTTYS